MSLGPRSESWLNLVPALASGVALTVTFLSLDSFIHELEALTPTPRMPQEDMGACL